jgi:hypothetical protein
VSAGWVAEVRAGLAGAEAASGGARRSALRALASRIDGEAGGSLDAAKVRMLAGAVSGLAGG